MLMECSLGTARGKEHVCNAGDMSSILEKEMDTHTSIPAWRIQWTEEPGRL